VTTFLSRHRAVLALLALALSLRVVLAFAIFPMQGYASDLGLFWQWARALAATGPGTFYASTGSADYPPAYLYVLWLLGLAGEPSLLKVPPILADLGVAAIAYALAGRWRGRRTGLVAAALFLFLPVSWYDSALWGQVDAVGTLVAMAALLLLVDGWSEAALATAVLSVLVKPQYAITLGVVIPVLVRRHLLRPGSGPVPRLGRRLSRLDAALGGLLRDQGPRRLVSSAVAAGLVALAVILPFDLAIYAPVSLADLPVIAQVAGLAGLFGRLGSEYQVLSANAFNPWALVGDPSLASVMGGGVGSWLADSLPVLGGIPAMTVGAALLVAVGAAVVLGLLVHDGIGPTLLGFTILALAFFVVPTRVHERYLFPFFATGAVLAAPSILAGLALAGAALLNAVNLHAVLAGGLSVAGSGRGPGGGSLGGFVGRGAVGGAGGPEAFGGSGGGFTSISLPFGDLARSELMVTASALGLGAALAVLLGTWVVVIVRRGRRIANPADADPAAADPAAPDPVVTAVP
jgi:hypothetical protein